MKKRLLTVAALSAAILLSLSLTVYAETTPEEDVFLTEPVIATEEPVYTEEIPDVTEDYTSPLTSEDPYSSDPYDTTPTEDYTGDTSAATGSTDSTETTAVPTTGIVTTPMEPTEPDEDSTFSDYVSPDPVYTPAVQDFQENDWQEIKLDLEAAPAPGKQSFEFIQNDTTQENKGSATLLIIGIVLLFVALAGITFLIIPIPVIIGTKSSKKGAAVTAQRPAQPQRRTQERERYTRTNTDNRRTFNPDDYNDGF